MPNSNLDPRLIAISDLLAEYSLGNFDNPDIELSGDLDEIDSIISGVNMLGQELKATTVSRDFFIDIYNTVSNILIVTDTDGGIIDANKAASSLLGFEGNQIFSKNVFSLIHEADLKELKHEIFSMTQRTSAEIEMVNTNGKILPIGSVWSKLYKTDGTFNGYLIVAEDLTDKKNKEREILRNITATQEAERMRVANDLHDSLGQELSSIRIFLAAITSQIENPQIEQKLKDCTEMLDASLQNIRSICFDLIPSALEGGELLLALEQTIRKMEKNLDLKFRMHSNSPKLNLPQEVQITIFRVFQEFVHNTVKHAACDMISVKIKEENRRLTIQLKDDGVGFLLKKGEKFTGRGMSTMISRIEALNGKARFTSSPGKGTALKIEFELDKYAAT